MGRAMSVEDWAAIRAATHQLVLHHPNGYTEFLLPEGTEILRVVADAGAIAADVKRNGWIYLVSCRPPEGWTVVPFDLRAPEWS
jgi:hypothetical protein